MTHEANMKYRQGFTLIEVLLALSILAIALSAMLKASSSTVIGTQKIKEKTLSHLVAMQAISMIQLDLVKLHTGQSIDKQEELFQQTWSWTAIVGRTPLEKVEKITIKTHAKPGGPVIDTFVAYRIHKDAQ